MAYTTLREVRDHVANRKEFKGNSIFGKWLDGNVYAVFSYHDTFPIYVYSAGLWFENQDGWKFSRSTHRHMRSTFPYGVNARPLPLQSMRDLLNPHTQPGSVLRMLAAAQETDHA